MKLQTANTVVPSIRCAHRTSGGRQCRRLALNAHCGLCPQHQAEQQQVQAADHFRHLTTKFQYFQTAQGINFSLLNLYQLLAENRISPRRAAVLAYINSLLLRTLPQIDADNAAGITDPTKLPAKSLTEHSTVLVPDKKAVAADQAPAPDNVHAWDSSNPQPDPNKKPS